MDTTSPIYLQTDASDYGIGAFLFQLTPDGTVRPVEFLSKSLSKVQRRWHTPDKEAYAIIYALKRWDYLLRDVRFVLQTDHKNLTYLNFEGTAKVKRWRTLISEYQFDIQYLKGAENVVADAFSRLCSKYESGAEPVGESQRDDMVCCYLSRLIGEEKSEVPTTSLDDKVAVLMEDYFDLESEDMLCTVEEVLDHPIEETIYQEIAHVHNALVGHCGVKRALIRLREKGASFKYMRALVRKFIRECAFCQKTDERHL